MAALIVGGDYIKPIEKIITERGLGKIQHWTGRKKGDLKRTVPVDTRLVVLLCDYLCHSLAKKVRSDAERLGLPVIYCRRSVGEFCEKLDRLLDSGAVYLADESFLSCCGSCPLGKKVKGRTI